MKKGILAGILMGMMALHLIGCKAKGDEPVADTLQEEAQQEETHIGKSSQAAVGERDLGTYVEPARLTPEEKELNVEEEQLFYGAFRIGLPTGITAEEQDGALEGQIVELAGFERYEEKAGKVNPRIRLACYQAEYTNEEALMVALLKLTEGERGRIVYSNEETGEYSFWIGGRVYQYYVFVRETELYLVEALYGGEEYAFPWLLEERQTVGWADTNKKAGFDGNKGASYMLLSVHEGLDFMVFFDPIKDTLNQTRFYLEGYYVKPYQTIENTGVPEKWGMKDWNFDGYADFALYEKIFLWNSGQEKFVEAKSQLEGNDFLDVQLHQETKTIWSSDVEYRGDNYFDNMLRIETLWQWEGETLVKIRECYSEETEEEIRVWAYENNGGELLFDELIPVHDKDREEKIRDLYESFYEDLVPEEFYALEHRRTVERGYIPDELVELLAQAIEEGREYEVLSSLMDSRELSEEEVIAIASENIDIRLELDAARIVGHCLMVEADVDNDRIPDILSQTYLGGTGGFVDFVLFQGKGDGTFEETERFGSVRQEFGMISFEGENYLCRTEFDYTKKLYSGLSLACYEEGKLVEEVYLDIKTDSYNMQVLECASMEYEAMADEMIQDGPLYKEKIDEYKTILGSAEMTWEEGEWRFLCDLDNDGKEELYDKYIWTTSNMTTRDILDFGGEEDKGVQLVREMIGNDEGWPIMMWVDTYGNRNIIHVAYLTGLYDFEVAGYLVEETEYSQVYRVRGEAEWYVDCERVEVFGF